MVKHLYRRWSEHRLRIDSHLKLWRWPIHHLLWYCIEPLSTKTLFFKPRCKQWLDGNWFLPVRLPHWQHSLPIFDSFRLILGVMFIIAQLFQLIHLIMPRVIHSSRKCWWWRYQLRKLNFRFFQGNLQHQKSLLLGLHPKYTKSHQHSKLRNFKGLIPKLHLFFISNLIQISGVFFVEFTERIIVEMITLVVFVEAIP